MEDYLILILVGAAITVAIALALVVVLPKVQTRSLKGAVEICRRVELENECRKTAATIAGGIFAIGGILLGVGEYWQRQYSVDREAAQAKRELVRELGSDQSAMRTNAVLELGNIAESTNHTQIAQILCTRIRAWSALLDPSEKPQTIPPDIQASLKVIGSDRRNPLVRLNLTHCWLRGADLRGLRLGNVDFRNSDLQRANVDKACFCGADFGAKEAEFVNLNYFQGLPYCSYETVLGYSRSTSTWKQMTTRLRKGETCHSHQEDQK